MPNKESDTDPSTPVARGEMLPGSARITPMKIVAVEASGDTDPAVPAPSKGVTTDPGVAPPPATSTASVPVKSAPPARPLQSDSVDMLLDGIAADKPAPSKTARESAGKASASYHAQHGLLRGQATPVPEDKVIVDVPKASSQPTIRIDRSQLHKVNAAATARPASTRGAEPTVVVPRAQGPRVVVALFAAVLLVFGIFVALKFWSVEEKKKAAATDPTATEYVRPPPSASIAATATATASSPTATTATTETAPAPLAATATATTTATASVTAPVPRASVAPPLATAAKLAPTRDPYPTQTTTATAPAVTTAPPPAPSPPPPQKTDMKRTLPM